MKPRIAALLVSLAVAVLVMAASCALNDEAAQARHGKGASTFPLKPSAHGPRVCNMQHLLRGKRPARYRLKRHSTYHGKPSCFWGVRTTKAVRRWKYVLGYPSSEVRAVWTKRDRDFALGKKRRPPAYVKRSDTRLAVVRLVYSYPLAVRGTNLGGPGQGTHSFRSPPNNWQSDRAIDLLIPYGTAVFAPVSGRVERPGCPGGTCSGGESRFGGARIYVVGQGYRFYISHLSRIAWGVREGMPVKAGQTIAYSGIAAGVQHIHFACERCDIVRFVTRGSVTARVAGATNFDPLLAPTSTCPIGSYRELLCLHNFARRKSGLVPLTPTSTLYKSAQIKARRIAECGTFSHTPCGDDFGKAFRDAGWQGSYYSENLVYGYPTHRSRFEAWLNSPGHRANILGTYSRQYGSGVKLETSFGRHLWVTHFAAP